MKKLFRIFTGNKKTLPITIVSGLPRSGTSMMMKMLEAGGMSILADGLRRSDEDNPKGYYEFERVKRLIDGDTVWLLDASGKVVKIISALLVHLPVEYTYQTIFMTREIPEILASQRKMLIRRGEDPDKINERELENLFKKHLQYTFDWINRQKTMRCLKISYNDLLKAPGPSLQEVSTFLNNTPDPYKMAAIIDPALYRQKTK